MQVMKEVFLPAFGELQACMEISAYAIKNIRVNPNILDDEMYDHLFTVEEVNRLTLQGMPFRDAYKEIGRKISEGTYKPNKEVDHTHEGSIGNLCLEQIRNKKETIIEGFNFASVKEAISKLTGI